ncbi:hypothetical protein GCM10011413_36850 [Pedobacter psychrotolerans]|uniref:Uncharacterized protein n=1 Tax=Pedobacter psychrotolerans TaxID=1843235 RepID=A0ABQ1SY31_9SPHI|nr:hypothetical protein GCM10011413_36850 [Pedobacter psychrotolerans]
MMSNDIDIIDEIKYVKLNAKVIITKNIGNAPNANKSGTILLLSFTLIEVIIYLEVTLKLIYLLNQIIYKYCVCIYKIYEKNFIKLLPIVVN